MWVVNVENVVWLHLIIFNSSDYHCTYDIVEFEIDGIRFNAHTGTILTTETYS